MTTPIRQVVRSVVVVAVAVVLVLCGAVLTAGRPGRVAVEEPGAAVADPVGVPNRLVGAWTRVGTCRELVDGLRRYGLEEFAPAAVLTDRFRPGATEPAPGPSDGCDGTVGRTVTRIFSPAGRLESLNGLGEQTGTATYWLTADDEVVVNRFAGIRVDYRLDGRALIFDVTVPTSCTTTRCRIAAQYAVSTFLPGTPWTRT